MLEVKNISKKFNHRSVLNDLSFKVEKGDFVIIMGPNGTGKSTLFDVISGKTLPDQGSVWIDQIDMTNLSEQKRALYVSRLFQNVQLGSCCHLTVRENLSLATLKQRPAGFKVGIESFPEKITYNFLKPLKLNLEHLLDVPMGSLSGGQRQIISFIMSILNPPKVLLLDEPTAALDPSSATLLLSFAKNYAREQKIPTLLITHDPIVAKHLGNRLWILKDGVIQNEFGLEKNNMDPNSYFQHLNYEMLC